MESSDQLKALCCFTAGQKVKIMHVGVDGVMRRRLFDLGFVPGSIVEVVRKSPLGDPIAFRVSRTTIALRREESEKIMGEPI